MTEKKQTAQFILLMAITGMMLYLCWQMFQPFIPVILWSSILVIIFYPIYEALNKKFKNHPVSAILTILISILVFVIPMFLIAVAIVSEISSVVGSTLGKLGEEINNPQDGQFMNFYNMINNYVNIEQFVKPEDLKNYMNSITGTVFQTTLGLLGGVAGTVINIFLSIFTMFYLFRDGKKIIEGLPEILPIPNAQAKELISKTSQLIDATLKGTLLVALLQGTLTGVILWLLGVPSPIILGVIAMICSLLPVAGTGIVTVPVILTFILSGEYSKAGIMIVFSILVIGMIDNFLLPKLIKQRAKMNELYVFFSVLGGLQLLGLLGLFVGPIILAIALGLLTVFKGGKISTEEITLG
jgi:predicted PurR-regulated permease PerM